MRLVTCKEKAESSETPGTLVHFDSMQAGKKVVVRVKDKK
jgi:hypothetical protein